MLACKDRVELAEGNFFDWTTIPAGRDGDLYFLRNILHDCEPQTPPHSLEKCSAQSLKKFCLSRASAHTLARRLKRIDYLSAFHIPEDASGVGQNL